MAKKSFTCFPIVEKYGRKIKMQISSVNRNIAFGKISHDAVNSVRRHIEGYNYDGFCDKMHSESYNADGKYKMMNSAQLKRLEKLVERADSLQKTLIAQTSESHRYFTSRTNEGITVFSSNEYNDRTCRFKEEDKGNADATLDVLERAVKYAEELEANDKVYPLHRERATYFGYGTVYVCPERGLDRFKSNEENYILRSIYSKALNITRGNYNH